MRAELPEVKELAGGQEVLVRWEQEAAPPLCQCFILLIGVIESTEGVAVLAVRATGKVTAAGVVVLLTISGQPPALLWPVKAAQVTPEELKAAPYTDAEATVHMCAPPVLLEVFPVDERRGGALSTMIP